MSRMHLLRCVGVGVLVCVCVCVGGGGGGGGGGGELNLVHSLLKNRWIPTIFQRLVG